MNVQKNGLEIAIIGLAGRFPGSQTLEAFWNNLKAGVESISVLPQGGQAKLNGANQSIKAAAILQDIEWFDAAFFGFNPREAETMDPQHRLFLECAWEALEHAGYNTETEARPIGVYAGVGMGTYLLYNLSPNHDLMASRGFLQTLVGVDKDYLSTRVSYKLNLTGPSMSVGTACSSSLTAVHLACQSLLSGECDMALAAGVAVKVPQNELTLSPDEIVAADGHCRAFDARANGTVGGNGIGAVVLKRLEDAVCDRDSIYAVIKGSAINNDGALKVGYTAPSQEGQTKVIRAAQVMAEVEPDTITYMETHGTGTPLGDPIEIAAMTQAFRSATTSKRYCAIGSVKTNVGHLDAAAGIAGLIKTTLALHHQTLPPSLNFETPNAEIDFANSPFYVNTELTQWTANGMPRRAGVSSFGFGGTNVHLILEEAPSRTFSSPSRSQQLLVLSAKTRSALETATAQLAHHLQQHPDLNLADVAYTLQVGRQAFEHRRIMVAANLENAVQALESSGSPHVFTQLQESSNRSVVFMFPGQGAQYVNMARELYECEVIFRDICDRCCDLLQPQLGFDLRQILYPTEQDLETAAQKLQQTAITQPALFVIEYALAKLWMSWGIQPVAMIGHSIGEYVAACLAGVFSLEDALSLVVTRGQLMQQQPSGAMLSVGLLLEDIQRLLGEINAKLAIAANNSPDLSVVSGSSEAIQHLEHRLTEQGVNTHRLHTSHAFHSESMDAIAEPFRLVVAKMRLRSPQIPFISNVTGTWITTTDATNPDYWAQHLRQTVHFTEGIAELLKDSARVFLEVGPGRTLSTFVKQQLTVKQQATERVILSSLRHPKDQLSDQALLLNTLGRLWLAGVQVNWWGFYQDENRDRLPLPTYPFERQRYWIEPPAPSVVSHHSVALEKKSDLTDWFYIPSWKRSISALIQSQEVPSCSLVLMDESGLGIQLVKRLEQQGQAVITVKVGSDFTQIRANEYRLNPHCRSDYDALLKELLVQQKRPNAIVHLWTITPEAFVQSGLERLEHAQEHGFYSLLFLAQALGKQNLTDKLHLTVISNNLQSVIGEEKIDPEKSVLLGPVKVIGQEYSNIRCCSVDVTLPAAGSSQEQQLIDQLLTEISVPRLDQIVAFRGGHRWVQTFEPVRLAETLEEAPCLRQAGVYLITGGLGGIGLVLAEHLAKTVNAKLVLTGRSELPDRNEWSHWLETHDETDLVSRKLQKVIALEALGAEVLVVSADVTHLEHMQRAIAQAQERFGQINGVIHAAGVPGGGVIQRKTREEAERVLAPKIRGTWVLDTVLQSVELDFFVLCSSLASTIGIVGQVDYAAANAFLDAFTHYKSATKGTFTTCINWDAWQEVGMAADAAKPLQPISDLSDPPQPLKPVNHPLFDDCQPRTSTPDRAGSSTQTVAPLHLHSEAFPSEAFLREGLLPSEGIKVFKRILGSKLPQVLVSTRDLLDRVDLHSSGRAVGSLAAGDQTHPFEKPHQSEPTHPRPELSQEYRSPGTELEQAIASIWQRFLGVNRVGIHDSFFELGGHSLMATQVIAQIGAAAKLDLSLNILFDHPTIAEIAQYIDKLHCAAQNLQTPVSQDLDDRAEIEL
ncbi:MAG: SDR family NAD(P)-dependent oxidoreductase [Aphanocapsa sp. GSE-SYN-MK-11-07L]|jgi:acyl transferase domain-containing protein/acyl carrier protein|nr:SDR family NAD(P)-dependent oxidoreductase [Aphanocapsa sp. GSE-SYN-MK-11-07L]